MYCTKFGSKLRDGAKFCHACGKPLAGAKQDSRTVDTGNRTADEVKGAVNAMDLAKAGARQIIAALKDRDINASATPGEVSCKPDAAQSAFMKLLKKGLLCILMLVGFSISSQAETVFSGLIMDRNTDLEKGITMTVTGFENDVDVNGVVLNGNTKKGTRFN